MASGQRNQGAHSLIVYRHPGLSGIELWHGLVGHATLYQLRDSKREYFEGLREFLVRLHGGRAESSDAPDSADLDRAAGFRWVVFCGGDAGHPLLAQALRSAPLPFEFELADSGPYAARAGARCVFDEMRWNNGVAFDLGQSRLKVISEHDQRVIPRDSAALPFGAYALDPARGIDQLRSMIHTELERFDRPDGVVLGLPVALDEQGSGRPATYPGLFGPVEPLFAGLFETPWIVVNDAVLAARGFPPPNSGKTLVVTLGFGIGGALWDT